MLIKQHKKLITKHKTTKINKNNIKILKCLQLNIKNKKKLKIYVDKQTKIC